MNASDAIRFGCTGCGRCCHDLRLTLSMAEAATWLDRGGRVEILLDALPVAGLADSAELDLYRARCFTVVSGSLEMMANMLLVATFTGPCPNLQADMLCGFYENRPNICRIYPGDMIAGRRPDPATKRCPPEAWAADRPLMFDDDDRIADSAMRIAIDAANLANRQEVAGRAWLARELGIDRFALRHEGFVVDRPDSALLRAALMAAPDEAGAAVPESDEHRWLMVSPAARTRGLIEDAGARTGVPREDDRQSYISFMPDQPA